MPRIQYKQEIYSFVAGPLGHIEGLTLSLPSSGQSVCHYFGGLPYALPPVGPYRFRRTRPLPDFFRYGTKASPANFTRQTAICPQPKRFKDLDSLWDENCLQLNIYIPASKEAPPAGWPVYFYIHGGFLQWGTANDPPRAIAPLLSETSFEAIIVMPAYRVNLFGFIAGKELQSEAERFHESAGNAGFWDQRTALEWTAKNIGYFGGDARNITIGGYSAGAHSVFHQLAHELYFMPDEEAVIKRAIMWSNSPGVQPRTFSEHQKQFDELLDKLGISLALPADKKLEKLRAVPMEDLVSVQGKLDISEFRATSDDAFVTKTLMSNINSGDFGRRIKARGIKLMNGECRDEHNLYQTWRTPSDSFDAVRKRLVADYPEVVVQRLMQHYCGGSKALPSGVKNWQDLFGRIYANMQVHHLERGFHRALERGGLVFGEDVLRYRFDWRVSCIDSFFAPSMGVTHATDMAIWFYGLDFGSGLSDEDKVAVKPWIKAFANFVKGEDPQWGTRTIKGMKRLKSDGSTDVWIDDQWEQGLDVWRLVNGQADSGSIKAKL